MNPTFILGVACTALGLLGYALGLLVDYPGRAFSITLVMIGVTLLAVRRVTATEVSAP